MKYLIVALNFCELTACIAGFYHWKKIKHTYWKWFPLYLGIIFLTEMTGKLLRSSPDTAAWNIKLYTYFGIPVQFLFFFWLFSQQQGSLPQKRLPIIATTVYIACWLTERLLLTETRLWFTSFSYTIGNLLLIILIIHYLLRFVNSDDILYYKQHRMFWVSVGLAVFYLGTFPFYALRNTLYYNYNQIFTVYQSIQLILDCLMYLIFSLAFLWGKPK